MKTYSIDRLRLAGLAAQELATFNRRTAGSAALLERGRRSMPQGVPMPWMHGLYRHHALFVDHGAGTRFYDVDGNVYLDFNVVDLAVTMGFTNPHIQAAVQNAMNRGTQFLLPIEDAIGVTEELARRTNLPYWQFTLAATGANTEVIRIARASTGRNKVLVFEGHYHGHLDDTLVDAEDGRLVPAGLGLPKGIDRGIDIVPFNNLDAAEVVLSKGETAVVITEPAMSNCTLVKPDPGYLEGLHSLTRQYGSLLCLDEAHTFSFGFGGLRTEWGLDSDFMVLGKGLGSGISFALYGMSEQIGKFVEAHTAVDLGEPGIAAGGTTYASTMAILSAKAALEHVLTPDQYAHTARLGKQLSEGLQMVFDSLHLPWCALHLGPRSGYCLYPEPPRTGAEAYRSIDLELIDARKVFMANRGVWDAMPTAGPQVSFGHTASDVGQYLECAHAFLDLVRKRN